MPLSIHFQPFFFLETIKVVMMSIFGGLVFIALAIIMILYFLKRQKRRLGEAIEAELDITSSYYLIGKEIQKAKQIKNYRKSVIYNTFAFRIISQEKLTVRNGRTIPFEELVNALRGSPNLDTRKVEAMIEIYEKARFTDSDITYEDSQKVEYILNGIIQSLNIDTTSL